MTPDPRQSSISAEDREFLAAQRELLKSLGFCCLTELPPVLTQERGTSAPSVSTPVSPPKSPQRPPAPAAPVASPQRVVPHQPLVSATSPFTAPLLTLEQRLEQLAAITAEAAACTACRLHLGRTNIVPGEGNPMAELMFIGEGPGESEDLQGRPFVGRSGELLTKIIEAMTFKREEVFIGNVVKCRPPENRKPHADEMETCLPYLARQVEIIRPKVIVTLGVTALTGLLPEHIKTPIGKIRGQWLEYRGIPVMPTLHPAFLLRQPTQKRLVWEDMQLVMAKFGRQPEKP